MITDSSPLWQYMSPEQRSLASDGQTLIEDRKLHPNEKIGDFSYLVFPFAKLYEGFLKQLFLDVRIISETDYRSDHFRIGKALSPTLVRRLGKRSAYGQIEERYGRELADKLWNTWKQGRNLVFHYFPHNYRKLTVAESQTLIDQISTTMEESVERTNVLQSRQ